MPRPIEWRAFYVHDLPLVTDLDPEVREWAVANRLNKSQTRAMNRVKKDTAEGYRVGGGGRSDAHGTAASSLLPGRLA